MNSQNVTRDDTKSIRPVIDVNGYSFSGKSLVYDLLHQGSDSMGLGREVEFDLIRVPGGIDELYGSIAENWSLIKASETLCRATRLFRNLAGKGDWHSLISTVANYEIYFPGFEARCARYIDDLVVSKYSAEWPFSQLSSRPVSVFLQKIKNRILRSNTTADVYLSRLTKVEFIELTREFLNDIFLNAENGNVPLILNNAVEPSLATRRSMFFYDLKIVIVDRDPRDIYRSASVSSGSSSKNSGSSVIGSSVYDFIERFKIQREEADIENTNVKVIYFDDLLNQPDKQLIELEAFLGVKFNRELCIEMCHASSVRNEQLKKRKWDSTTLTDLQIIEQKLAQFLRY